MGLGILTLSISARYFGLSIDRDEWVLAMGFILVLDTAIWGPINETFRAKFVFLQHEIGNEASLAKAKSMFSFINFVTAILVVIILVYPRILTKVIAPNYSEAQLVHLTTMILILTPSFLFNQICQFLTSVLNAYNTFYVPEITGLVTSILNIVLIITLAPIIGIYSLALGYYAGILLLLTLLVLRLKKLNIAVIGNPFKFKPSDIKPFVLFSLPFFLPYFLGQFNTVVEKSIASTLNVGTVSMIDYARKFPESVITVLTSIFTTMLLPTLSSMSAKEDRDGFLFEFKSMYQLSFLIMTFLVSLFSACPSAVINLLYNKGSIGISGLTQISNLCMLYCWAALVVFLYIIFGIALLSSGKGKTYAFFGSIAQVIMIGLNFSMVKILGVYTFPLSLLISHLAVAVILFTKFPIKGNKLIATTIKGILQIMVCSCTLYLLNHNINMVNSFHPLIIIIFNLLFILLFVLGFAYLLKTEDRQIIEKVISKTKAYF